MKAASQILLLIILGGCVMTGGIKTATECDKAANLDALNDAQKAYMEWTESRFASYLNRDEYAGLSDSTRKELEQKWIAILEGPWNEKYYNAINSLAAIKSKKAVKHLLKVSTERREKDNRDRWMATRALGIVADESVVPELIHLIYHYNQNTRFWAQISLVRLTGVNFGSDWQKWANWWNQEKGNPPFLPQQVTWTTNDEWADEKRQQESDKAFVDRLKRRSQERPTTTAETYIVTFEPVATFEPQTAKELLDAFNKNHPRAVRTHHYRTRVKNNMLVGHICVDTNEGKDLVVSMLEESRQLKLVEAHLATQKDLEKLFKLGQPSLKK